ncbi:unnamed protein product [Cyprideis torosa]|uniref:Uncharacterized protein n=1 Tax=Cyprideis torosa TaxID=163714 RepID=A0A7R8WEU1_9CRUS|nr:unnamed protein product [Cyprideis torosa]CAG0893318.1 unnamed protein product [Cyprideis torosa]
MLCDTDDSEAVELRMENTPFIWSLRRSSFDSQKQKNLHDIQKHMLSFQEILPEVQEDRDQICCGKREVLPRTVQILWYIFGFPQLLLLMMGSVQTMLAVFVNGKLDTNMTREESCGYDKGDLSTIQSLWSLSVFNAVFIILAALGGLGVFWVRRADMLFCWLLFTCSVIIIEVVCGSLCIRFSNSQEASAEGECSLSSSLMHLGVFMLFLSFILLMLVILAIILMPALCGQEAKRAERLRQERILQRRRTSDARFREIQDTIRAIKEGIQSLQTSGSVTSPRRDKDSSENDVEKRSFGVPTVRTFELPKNEYDMFLRSIVKDLLEGSGKMKHLPRVPARLPTYEYEMFFTVMVLLEQGTMHVQEIFSPNVNTPGPKTIPYGGVKYGEGTYVLIRPNQSVRFTFRHKRSGCSACVMHLYVPFRRTMQTDPSAPLFMDSSKKCLTTQTFIDILKPLLYRPENVKRNYEKIFENLFSNPPTEELGSLGIWAANHADKRRYLMMNEGTKMKKTSNEGSRKVRIDVSEERKISF